MFSEGYLEMDEVQNKYSLNWLERLHGIVSQETTQLDRCAQEQNFLPIVKFRLYVARIFDQLKKNPNKEMLWFDLARTLKEELKDDFDYYKLWEVVRSLAYLSFIKISEDRGDGNHTISLLHLPEPK